MAKLAPPLNDTQIENAKPQEKEYNLGDGHCLTLRIKPNGTKLWRFNYQRPITNQRANLSFGKYPDLSLAKARAKIVAVRELLADGIDPKEHRPLLCSISSKILLQIFHIKY